MPGPVLPATMRAMSLTGMGSPAVFEMVELAVPHPGPGEFLVRVAACGVCGHDALARQGKLTAKPGDVLGHEIAGTVIAVGSEEVADWIGTRVALVQRRSCGHCPDCAAGATSQCRCGPGFYGDDIQGGCAEYVIADSLNAVALPPEIPGETAAILSCGVGTGLRALTNARVGTGDLVVITGAGGGVGINAVQMAHALGLRVIATTTDEAKSAAIVAAGAEHVLVRPDARTIRKLAAAMARPRGVDAVIEVTGAPTFATSLRSLAPGGRLVLVGNVTPEDLDLDPGLTIVKELNIIGSAHATREDLRKVVDMVASKSVVPIATQSYALSDVAHAHAALDDRTSTGRTVIVP